MFAVTFLNAVRTKRNQMASAAVGYLLRQHGMVDDAIDTHTVSLKSSHVCLSATFTCIHESILIVLTISSCVSMSSQSCAFSKTRCRRVCRRKCHSTCERCLSKMHVSVQHTNNNGLFPEPSTLKGNNITSLKYKFCFLQGSAVTFSNVVDEYTVAKTQV